MCRAVFSQILANTSGERTSLRVSRLKPCRGEGASCRGSHILCGLSAFLFVGAPLTHRKHDHVTVGQGLMWPQANECRQHLILKRARNGFSLEPLEGAHWPVFDFSPVTLILNRSLTTRSMRKFFCCFGTLLLWQFLTIAAGKQTPLQFRSCM